MNGTIRAYGESENIITVLENSFTDTTVTIELTPTSAKALGFSRMAVSATIPKSALFDIADKARDTDTTIMFA